MNPWLGMGMVLGALAGLMGGLRLYQRRFAPHPEWVRKLLHVSMGLVTLSFPWVFTEAWPVIALAAITIPVLLAVRNVRGIKEHLGPVLGDVHRSSLGEVYFPLAVALLFVLHLREPPDRRLLLYVIPVLILALADAVAALVGVRFGRLRYPTVEGFKSTEGSFAFFAVAFAATWFPLHFGSDLDPEKVWLIALLLGFLAMLFEAIAWHGLDNLVLPLATFLLLKSYLALPIDHLVARVMVTSALVAFALIYRQRTTLAGSALLGAALVGYLSWTLGGLLWLLPPLLFFTTYKLLPTGSADATRRTHNVYAVLCVSSAGLTWLFLYALLDRPELLFLYTLGFAAHLAIIGLVRLKRAYPHLTAAVVLPICVAAGWLLLFVPLLLAGEVAVLRMPWFLAALAGVALAAGLFFLVQPDLDDCPTNLGRWLRQATAAGLGSLLGLVPLYLLSP